MKVNKILIIFLVLISLVLSGCIRNQGAMGKSEKPGSNDKEINKVEDNSIAVEVMKLEAKTIIKEYNTAGKLYASEEINVSSEMKGKVKSINFNVGEKVNKGDVLYTLDSEDLRNDVDLQKSKLQKNLEDAKRRYDNELKNLNNMKSLYETGAISKDQFDSAQTSYESTKSSYEQAQKDLNSNSISLNSNINDTMIKSPINGIVSNKNIDVGEMTTTNDFVIVNIDSIIAKTDVSEDVVNEVSVGDIVKVMVQSNEYVGTIKTISPIGKNNGNIYPVEIEIENKDMILKPGMFADIYFEMEKIENQIAVPRKSVLSDGESYYVYIIKDNQPQKVIVQKGITKDGYVQISGELTSGDILVVKGQEYITEESSIKIVNEFTLNE